MKRISMAVIGIVLGIITWHTDMFQKLVFPVDYWTAKVNQIDSDIAFTQSLIAQPDATKDEQDMWQEYVGYEKEDREIAMEALIKQRGY